MLDNINAVISGRCPQLRVIWLSCEGETPADTENMGPVTYTPWHGFPGSELEKLRRFF